MAGVRYQSLDLNIYQAPRLSVEAIVDFLLSHLKQRINNNLVTSDEIT
jgi:hypothetical protein